MDKTTKIGELNGQVADTIQNFVVIAELLTNLTESRLQADFYATTGIRCNRKVRLLMEKLMENHGFTSHELKRPWRSGALVPVGNEGDIKVASRVFDLTFGWGGAVFATLTYLLVGFVFVIAPDKDHSLQALLSLAIASSLYLMALALLSYLTIWPQRTAMRVQRVLREHGGAAAVALGLDSSAVN